MIFILPIGFFFEVPPLNRNRKVPQLKFIHVSASKDDGTSCSYLEIVMLEGRFISGSARWIEIPLGRFKPDISALQQVVR